MNIHEYQAAEILTRYGIPVNAGIVAQTPEEAETAAAGFGRLVAIKAQVHSGGRGKAGGIKLAKTPADAKSAADAILGMDIRGHQVNKVLVAPGVNIASEFYLGVILDRPNRQILIMASAEGGVDIEEVAANSPEKIVRINADPYLGFHPYQARQLGFELGIPADKINGFAAIAQALFKAYVTEDATLAEINPLILTGEGDWLALDSKISFDDNALFRHNPHESLRDMAEENETEIEAKRSGISFVKLDGNIGCIVNGAGLGDGDDGRRQTQRRRAGQLPRCGRRRQRRAGRQGLPAGDGRSECSGDFRQYFRRHHPGRCRGERYSRSAFTGKGAGADRRPAFRHERRRRTGHSR